MSESVFLSGDENWWRQAVVYQVYPRSFKDSNGDGLGDIKGITSKVDYLSELGVDAIWLSPFYPSALADGGYDVADYRDVDPKLGNLAEFDEMIAAYHAKGIRVFADIVPNHSSDLHVWFQEALKAEPGSAARDRYIFRDGKGENGELPPNNWPSHFGPTGWTRTTNPDGTPGQWYLHLFAPEQPDFNWDNEEVIEDFKKTLRFWSDRGVDGFRIDVAHAMKKDMSEPYPHIENYDVKHIPLDGSHHLFDRDDVMEIYKGWREIFNSYNPPRVAVAEAWVPAERRTRYASPETLGQAFNFDLLSASWSAKKFKKTIEFNLELSEKSGSSSTWVLSNHDVIRHATRFAYEPDMLPPQGDGIGPDFPQPDEAKGLRRARAASAFMLGLPGGAYIYQGEELGLPEHTTLGGAYRQDPTYARTQGKRVGRDGCRVPLPWVSKANESNGFSSTGQSWLPQPSSYARYARDLQDGVAGSTLEVYKRVLKVRKQFNLGAGNFKWAPEFMDETTLAFINNGVLVLSNFEGDPVVIPAGEILATTQADLTIEGELEHDQTVWIKL